MSRRTQGFNLEVTFLGTSGSWPSAKRNVSATAVRRGGEILLFDCGEGTQRQFQKSPLSHMAVTKIFLTHLHGDHCYGLPGYLKTMQLNEREEPLAIFGPPGTENWMHNLLRFAPLRSSFPIQVLEMEPERPIHFTEGYTITPTQGDHSVAAYAYRLQEDTRPGAFDKPKALELGVPEGPAFGALQKGGTVTTPDGKTIHPEDVMGPARPGRSLVVSGDTRPSKNIIRLAKDADLLIHEATYTDTHQELAYENQHSTAAEAATVAREAGVRTLYLHHISPRYEETRTHLEEARKIFEDTHIAEDFLTLDVPFPERGPVQEVDPAAQHA
jgi:ribonuclease Z